MTRSLRLVPTLLGAAALAMADAAAQAPVPQPVAPPAASPVVRAQQLQILAVTVPVRAEPSAASLALAEMSRGAVIGILDQRGEWYKVPLDPQRAGWIHMAPAEYGEMTIEVFDAPAGARTDTTGSDMEHGITPARPGAAGVPQATVLPTIDPSQVPPPQANLPRESVSVPDRWRLMQTLGFKFPWYDPYNQNVLKADLPVLKQYAPDLFFNLGVVSDSLLELRRLPTPVAGQIGIAPGANDIFGRGQQTVMVQNLVLNLGLIKGDTTFRPPDYELRFVPVFNFNRALVQEAGALRIDPSRGRRRSDNFVGIQEMFADVHLRNVSDRYDFDSVRVGIQPFTNDFRGFLFQDSPFGVRLFGNRDNNRWQYNLAAFARIEKDSNSGLNAVGKGLRKDQIYLANLYRQDWPWIGFTSQASIVHNRNQETDKTYDTNGFLVRPAFLGDLRSHRYHVTYLGYSGDGHLGAWNLATSTYLALGHNEHDPLAHSGQKIRAGYHASELSRDFSWIRARASLVLASGDKDPYDNKSTGFDAIMENPQIAGSDTSFSIRQGLPLIGGGGVALSGRNGILPSLRSSKDEGQSNFVNPGLALIGVGADMDLAPELRVFGNVSYLRFMETRVLEVLRAQAIPSKEMGTDFSVGMHWRPFYNQNVIINSSVAALRPGKALKALYGDKQGTLYSVLFNMVLSF
ncbi:MULTISPECIES: SH3 domain-containing protein [unclassified Duganella]|uniref:SH3 domain-containing protein n=1 Tax=unclassified Duganella TaxID=2636909 RepID=UPI000B7CC7BF|nr:MULTISPECIES: SH3 domain-containing protein [unclassified Duganella]